jgi:putative methionine-R-sulfoxide reductase with GAF domain
MIQPVFSAAGRVIGTVDVESDRVNAFSSRDEALLAACAAALRSLWDQEALSIPPLAPGA